MSVIAKCTLERVQPGNPLLNQFPRDDTWWCQLAGLIHNYDFASPNKMRELIKAAGANLIRAMVTEDQRDRVVVKGWLHVVSPAGSGLSSLHVTLGREGDRLVIKRPATGYSPDLIIHMRPMRFWDLPQVTVRMPSRPDLPHGVPINTAGC